MIETANKALLPTGLRDILPPDAALEAHVIDRLGDSFRVHGYERVKPPLIEFEESLLGSVGAPLSKDTFRVMDPISQRMMGVRADMTVQVARIAATRLGHAPRPLRLCYSGQVLRVKGSQLRPERQFTQAGLELIGSDAPTADAEVAALTASALCALGVKDVTVDLNMPTMVPAICDAVGVSEEARLALRAALDQKDEAAVNALAMTALPKKTSDLFVALLHCVGNAKAALARLETLELPAVAAAQRAQLHEAVDLIELLAPDLSVTVDVVENRGFEYHTGISFSVFAPRARGELARGGRYLVGDNDEPAVGATVDVDAVMDVLPPLPVARRLFVPVEERAAATRLRAEGWVTVAGLESVADVASEAVRLGCSYYLRNGAAVAARQE